MQEFFMEVNGVPVLVTVRAANPETAQEVAQDVWDMYDNAVPAERYALLDKRP